MKRSVIALMLCFGFHLAAATIGAPAATVRLTKTTPISMAELEAEVAEYQQSAKAAGQDPATIDPLQVLNLLINNELFRQGAARDGVKITDAMMPLKRQIWKPRTTRKSATNSLPKSSRTTLAPSKRIARCWANS